jgi:hypothetical protein
MAMIQSIMGTDTKVLTDTETLQSFFLESYQQEKNKSETESWETRYREIWLTYQNTDIMKEAINIPSRIKISRKNTKDNGLIIFGKKGPSYIFKMGNNEESILIDPEFALPLFEASIKEEGYPVTKNFYAKYDKIKPKLFIEKQTNSINNRKDVLIKIQTAVKSKTGNVDYLKDLLKIIKLDALSGYDLRKIKKMEKEDLLDLPNQISQHFIDNVLHVIEKMDEGSESIILSEELIGR